MSIEFLKPSGRKVSLVRDGVLERSMDISCDVKIKPATEHEITITDLQGIPLVDFDWRTVVGTFANREAVINYLLQNFFFDITVEQLSNITFKVAYYAEITTISGQISVPQGATILLDQWANGVDALVSKIVGTKPDFEDSGVDVTSFDVSGNYTTSAALPSTPAALIYYVSILLKDFENLDVSKIIAYTELGLRNPVEKIIFTTTLSNELAIGELAWNAASKCLQYGVEGGEIDINQEIFDYYIDIDNNLVEGNIVSVVSISGNRQAVRKTDSTSSISATACIGMVTNKNSNGTVRVTKKGRVRKINTNGLTEGLPVYANYTTVGGYTQTVPQAPNYFIHLGIVEVANTNNGIIDIDIRISPKLPELSDVNGTPLSITGLIPVWDNIHQYFDFTENIYNYQKKIIPDNTDAASSANVGQFRYRKSGNNSYIDLCMQTGAATYEWINVKQNNW